jgi:hypothetical protein
MEGVERINSPPPARGGGESTRYILSTYTLSPQTHSPHCTPVALSTLPTPMSDPSPAWEARRLLRAARVGTLASVADGQPFATLVTPACAPDLSLLLLLSDLSEPTPHLRAEPRRCRDRGSRDRHHRALQRRSLRHAGCHRWVVRRLANGYGRCRWLRPGPGRAGDPHPLVRSGLRRGRRPSRTDPAGT